MNERHPNVRLYLALLFLMAMPSVFETVRVFLVSGVERAAIQVAAQIEWFHLIDEVLAAFFILPLYHVLQSVRDDMPNKAMSAMLLFTGIYALTMLVLSFYTASLVRVMDVSSEIRAASIVYLRWESVAFVLGFIRQFWLTVLVIHRRSGWVLGLAVLETCGKALADFRLIPTYEELGIAYSNVLNNGLSAGLAGYLLYRTGLIAWGAWRWAWLVEAFRKGVFSSLQILLNNVVYALFVVQMMNRLVVQDHYWVANHFIWGWLLLPIMPLMELVKREGAGMLSPVRARRYVLALAFIVGGWLLSVPAWNGVFATFLNSSNPAYVTRITLLLLPFYVVFVVGFTAENILYGLGKTHLTLLNAMVVNLLYYPCVYIWFWYSDTAVAMEHVVAVFGFGMVISTLGSMGLVYRVWKGGAAR